MFDPLERLVLKRGRLLSLVEEDQLFLPASGIGTEDVTNAYDALVNWLTASKSDDRKKAKRAVDRLIESEEGSRAVSIFVEAQRDSNPYNLQITELNNLLERTLRPPSYFRIRGIFQPHKAESAEEADSFKQQLRVEIEQTFKPEDNNVFFMEDAEGDFYNNKDFYDSYSYYRLHRKAFIFVTLKAHTNLMASFLELQRRNGELVDELVDKQMGHIDAGARTYVSPVLSYIWTQMQVVDEFIEKGYPIKILFERGSKKYHLPDLTKEDAIIMPPNQYAAILRESNDIMEARREPSNKDIAQQLTELERLSDPKIRTNVLMIFGSAHIGSVNNLPTRLQQVTTTTYIP